MKILVIANYKVNSGGISGVVSNHVKNLKNEGHEIEIFNTRRNIFVRLFLIVPLYIKSRKFQVIHIHGCSYLGFYPIVLGIFANKIILSKKTIVSFHGGGAEQFLRKYSWLARFILKKADSVTVMSDFFQDIFKIHGIDTVILPNLIDLPDGEIGIPDLTIPRIVSVRSLNVNYNIADIIKAFELVKRKYKSAELRIFSTGSEIDNLIRLVNELKLKDVFFLGSIPSKQIPDELRKSNIFVSVPTLDNQPLSILEAFSVGIPVISSNVGGIPFMIRDSYNGFLVDVNDPGKIYEKIEWIFENQEKLEGIVINAKASISKHKWSVSSKLLMDLYSS